MHTLSSKYVFRALLTAVVCCFHFTGAAQQYLGEERNFYGGLILGMNRTQVDGDVQAGYSKTGLNTGGIVYLKLDEHVAASIEILYSQKGAWRKDYDYRIKLNYAEVPIMLNYFDKRKSHFGGGLSYSRLASSSEDKLPYFAPNTNPNIDLLQYPFKKGDLNLLLSGNLHVWKGFFFNLRFQYSLLSIRSNVPAGYGRNAQFNNLWAIRVMYLFM
jgi:hypothetical protein